MTFDEAFEILLKHEGGFVDHAADPGGATRFGITQAVARANGYDGDMRHLPLETARRIAKDCYWDAVRADELPASARYAVFDAAYHSGPRQSIQWLQRAVGANPDGIFGPRTLAAVQSANIATLRARILSQRLRFLTNLSTWGTFGRGWSRRIADLMEM